ncbi:Cu(I)-responsive transcriptional regulator [Zhongshania aliphaticivorans]|uniref:Cu(I)-responsive transcriptional regulator n=1 Tax=Zhongshania aliphaticivorans TaxID=1470434 RepID=UPI0012E55D33|nr:Cu(I)-responsive transcriptional regulator [Zhongshania aliphaticivorans]CAA0119382.1 HTH-type transcriptional regulator HmrR [Zhongshania aliphaticivorans]
MNIGEAAKASGISVKMIRHYESLGLIKEAARTPAGYRLYSDNDVHSLSFIKSARSLGFSLAQIEQLLSLWADRDRASADVKTLAISHIDELNAKIHELTAMRDLLADLASNCHGDNRADCPILSGLENVCASNAG